MVQIVYGKQSNTFVTDVEIDQWPIIATRDEDKRRFLLENMVHFY